MRLVRLLAFALLVLGCSKEQLGLPRTHLAVSSPDGRYVAIVRNHPNIDPPDQTLWIVDRSGNEWKVRQLGEDSQWCNHISWSADGSTASFLVEGTADHRWLVTADVRSRQVRVAP